jgi:hypothetical protein
MVIYGTAHADEGMTKTMMTSEEGNPAGDDVTVTTCTRVHRNNGHRRTRSDEVVASLATGGNIALKNPLKSVTT